MGACSRSALIQGWAFIIILLIYSYKYGNLILKISQEQSQINFFLSIHFQQRGNEIRRQKIIILTHWLLELFAKNAFFWTFWCFLRWISAKLALIRLKMHLQHNSLIFLPPASRFTTLWLGHVQKSKFWHFWNFFSPSFFLLFCSFCCSDWPSIVLACG